MSCLPPLVYGLVSVVCMLTSVLLALLCGTTITRCVDRRRIMRQQAAAAVPAMLERIRVAIDYLEQTRPNAHAAAFQLHAAIAKAAGSTA